MSSLKYHVTDCRLRAESHELKVKSDRILKLLTLHFALLTTLFLTYSPSFCAEIRGPEVRLQNNWIHVTCSLAPDETYLQELRNGVRKEIIFHIDLFRVWNMWPDEFVLGKVFVRTMKSDLVKMEYVSTSNDGTTRIRKRFQSLESMMLWSLSVDDLMLAHIKELEAGLYFVRVTVESRKRKLPPVLGYFMIFLPENEFKITKDSSLIMIGSDK